VLPEAINVVVIRPLEMARLSLSRLIRLRASNSSWLRTTWISRPAGKFIPGFSKKYQGEETRGDSPDFQR